MSAREDFGHPEASDLMLALGDVYLARGSLVPGLLEFLSGVSRQVAADALRTALIQIEGRPDGN